MKQNEQSGFPRTELVEAPSEPFRSDAQPSGVDKPPFLPKKEISEFSLRDNARLFVIGGGIVLVLLLLAFSGISKKSNGRPSRIAAKPQQHYEVQRDSNPPESITPILDDGRVPLQDLDQNLTNPEQIAHTATKESTPKIARNVGSVPPFESVETWQPAPYRPASQSAAARDENAVSVGDEVKNEHDEWDKASLVFVRNNPSLASPEQRETSALIEWTVSLPPGTRLRARLEAAVNTAVPTPVVAVIEYSYEQGNEIVIPAGAKAFGHLETADRSGYIGVRFDSLLMPDGSWVNLEATATDLQLRPLRGIVEGKHSGKNIFLRSAAGVGEIAATLVGRGSLNQPLNESDLLRERVTNNIGQASDQAVSNLAITERIVVSVPASTEMYVVLQKPAKDLHQVLPAHREGSQASNELSVEHLREILQLERELSQSDTSMQRSH